MPICASCPHFAFGCFDCCLHINYITFTHDTALLCNTERLKGTLKLFWPFGTNALKQQHKSFWSLAEYKRSALCNLLQGFKHAHLYKPSNSSNTLASLPSPEEVWALSITLFNVHCLAAKVHLHFVLFPIPPLHGWKFHHCLCQQSRGVVYVVVAEICTTRDHFLFWWSRTGGSP